METVVDYWYVHYVKRGACSLCGNVGMIDTRATARTPAGLYCGAVNYCICPNGQTMRENYRSSGIGAETALEDYVERSNARFDR